MLCGFLPFEDENVEVLYKNITDGVYELPEFLSSSSKDLISLILNTDP